MKDGPPEAERAKQRVVLQTEGRSLRVRASRLKGSGRGYSRLEEVSMPDTVRFWLHVEGAAALIAGVVAYRALGGDWLWLIPLLLVPDLSIAGYLAGPVTGAFVYNLVHNWAVGLGLLGAGLWLWSTPIGIAGAVLVAHVGMDRLAGYGLKHSSGFKDTHLQRA
jgi:hypothetical protein